MCRKLPILGLVAAVVGSVTSVQAADSAEKLAFFEKEVRPLLISRCFECHSSTRKIKGGLALDTRDAMLKGGDSGAAVVPGDLEKSKLIEAVRYQNHDLQMPPKGQLAAREIQALEAWVKAGAADPRVEVASAKKGRVINIDEGRKFWSFTPLARVEPPAIKQAPTPIDAFLQAKLQEKGLSPAAPADKRALIRRATFDLIGLPPTPQEVEAFLADHSPQAFDRVIERLLASPP